MQLATRRPLSLLMLATALACAPTPAGPASAPAPAPALTGPPTMVAPTPGDERFTGRVRERLPAGPYTYLHVATDAGDRWVVTMGAAPAADLVEVRNMGTQKNFHAHRLRREFDELVFGIVAAAPTGKH